MGDGGQEGVRVEGFKDGGVRGFIAGWLTGCHIVVQWWHCNSMQSAPAPRISCAHCVLQHCAPMPCVIVCCRAAASGNRERPHKYMRSLCANLRPQT